MSGLANLKAAFTGMEWRNAADAVLEHANRMRLSVNVIRPCEGFGANIDVDHGRLNVYLDKNFRITKFNIG